VVQRIKDADHAVALANDSIFGLSAGVWTKNIGLARDIAGRLEAGVVWINDYGVFNPAMPFGGVKLSGSSHREWSHLALDAYLEHKSIWEANS
jgi:acyl-CoA reductase-like NAD-dependent aldehyde dehydrogenase